MCLACEQDAMWFAYLQRKGLITNGYLVEQPPSLLDPVQSDAAPTSEQEPQQNAEQRTDKSGFSCDDPAAQ